MTAWEEKRDQTLRRNYGMTLDRYYAMWRGQDGRCAICEDLIIATGPCVRELLANVDHCHHSGIVRGLLCARCNKGVGHFVNDLARLRAAADYLQPHWDYLS